MCACIVAVDFVAAAYFFRRALWAFPRRRDAPHIQDVPRFSADATSIVSLMLVSLPHAGPAASGDLAWGYILSVRIVPQSRS
jgi:hypothetical protein